MRLQGILAMPDDYKPGEKRPMIVTFYEKNSQNMHVYTPPVYMVSMGRMPTQAVSDGYLTMMPDVHFRTGSSHSDMLECVEAATRKVIEMGYADPKRIGVTGHSYGGEGAAYVGTMSKMFAAVGMGAGVVDLYQRLQHELGLVVRGVQGGSGDTAFQYYLYDQGRWGFSPWDQPDRYRNESALTWAPKAVAPFLIMHGTSDPTVGFINGLAFYNALRYNGKKAVLLAYPGEGHHLGGVANQKDLTVRFMEFFDHYLKGAPAPKWLTDGVPYLKKDAKPEPAKPEPVPASTAQPEATSLLGRPLYAIELAPEAKQAVEARVVAAREALSRTPDNPDAILWLGRQTAAAGRVRLAIDIFTKGIAQFPADPRFYRHRGHRYVTVREFDKAIADLAHAAQLVKGKPDQPEPSTADAKVMSSETLHYAIYYHLGLAHYLKGDFAAALPVYRQCLAAAKANASDDLTAGASDWLYMTLRRLGRRGGRRQGARADRPRDEGQGRPAVLRPPDDVQGREEAGGTAGPRTGPRVGGHAGLRRGQLAPLQRPQGRSEGALPEDRHGPQLDALRVHRRGGRAGADEIAALAACSVWHSLGLGPSHILRCRPTSPHHWSGPNSVADALAFAACVSG